MTPRVLLRGIALALVAVAVVLAVSYRPANVILVISDSLRSRNVQLYGYEKSTTPNLEALRSSSLIYDHAYSHYTFTWPTLSSLFTGAAYSDLVARGLFETPERGETGLDYSGGLGDRNRTLAERLAARGVRSFAISASPYVSRRTGFDQGFESFLDWDNWGQYHNPPEIPYVSAESIHEEVRRRLESLRSDTEPWFLYLHYMDTHMAYHAQERDLAQFADPETTSERVQGGAMIGPDGKWLKWAIPPDAVSPDDAAYLEAHYDAQILRFDRAMGWLLDELERLGLRENTLVVITSDHGESLFERGFWGHGYLSRDEEQHVPLIVVLPPGSHGRRVDFAVSTTDLFWSLVAHFGAEAPPAADSLLPTADVLRGIRYRTAAYSEGPGGTSVFRDGRFSFYRQPALADEKRHRIRHSSGDYLFDLSRDPREEASLLPSSDGEAERRRDELIEGAPPTSDHDRSALRDPMLDAGGRLRKSLRALGYVE